MTKPNFETATAGFADIFKKMQDQRAAWWAYLTFPAGYEGLFAVELIDRVRAAFITVAFVSKATVHEKGFKPQQSVSEIKNAITALGCWSVYENFGELCGILLFAKEDIAIIYVDHPEWNSTPTCLVFSLDKKLLETIVAL